jgi:DNA-binding protein H-NS
MPKTLARIERQIEALEREADVLRKKEAAAVVSRIKDAIAYYQLTAQDLGLTGALSARRGAAARGSQRLRPETRKQATNGAAAKGAAGATRRRPAGAVVRFRDDAGNTWSGRGPRPAWFKAALRSGKTPEQLRS